MSDLLKALAELGEALPGIVVVALWIFLLIWCVLLFLLPFFVFGAWRRAKEVSEKMDTLIHIQQLTPSMPTENPRSKDDIPESP